KITLENQISILPPTRVAWIPPKIRHRAEMRSSVGYRSIYLNVSETELISAQSEVLEATPLLQALLERIAISSFDSDWHQGRRAHWLA
ncbi:AraC family transcriptional regulator, partial [Xenorhabdus bovienii]|nr:AraC family transcriptional regulator [Xenorhabdus bovienii]